MGGKFVLFDPASKKFHQLDDQKIPEPFAGQRGRLRELWTKPAHDSRRGYQSAIVSRWRLGPNPVLCCLLDSVSGRTRWMRLRILIVLIVLALGAVVVIVGFAQIKLDAIQEPGQFETDLATRAKHILIRWNSRDGILPAPTNLPARFEEGNKLYRTERAACHGLDGRTPTDTGRWMYPRAADLTSPDVQQYADRELFWNIKNGIRLSGMPAFARVKSDEHIWNLVQYIKTLPENAHPKSGGAAQ
jgi:mono/diheme cytochrome c family protein